MSTANPKLRQIAKCVWANPVTQPIQPKNKSMAVPVTSATPFMANSNIGCFAPKKKKIK